MPIQLLYSYAQAAQMLGLGSEQALRDLVCKGNGPQKSKMGSRVLFKYADLVSYVQALPTSRGNSPTEGPAVKRPVGRPTVKSRLAENHVKKISG